MRRVRLPIVMSARITAALMLGLHIFHGSVEAAEGGGSHNLPGVVGDIALA